MPVTRSTKYAPAAPFSGRLLALLCGAVVGVLSTAAEAASTSTRRVEPGISAQIVNGKNIYLLANAQSRDAQEHTARQVMLEPDVYSRYRRNPGLRIPLYRLNPEYRRAVAEALFPNDRATRHGWEHRVTYADSSRDGGESLWRIAEWFTGSGQNWSVIASYNGLTARSSLRIERTMLIPNRVLLRAYWLDDAAPAIPPAATVALADARPRWADELSYHTDADGRYARYRMKRGETLYTDVVVRFTDRVAYAEVMDAARDIADRSDIGDVRKIRSGQAVQIPVELLSVEYRPPDDPLRQEYEQTRALARSYFNTSRRMNLRGILVVLDAGHGGEDPGAIGQYYTYEDEVCYDVAVRAKRIFETETAAEVVMLVEDRSQGFAPSNDTRFSHDKDEFVLTNPPYLMTDAKVAVNLRWYLANSIYRRAVASGVRPEDIVFTSFHADALHPAVHGTMIYIPGARYTRGPTGRSGSVYLRRTEVREAQYVTISWAERVRMEGRSHNFARVYINTLREHGAPIHEDKPIRDVIHRGRYRFVPGVIRQNLIPNKILVELVNLKNAGDAQRITSPAFREKLARAYVNAVITYYGGEPEPRLATRIHPDNGLAGE